MLEAVWSGLWLDVVWDGVVVVGGEVLGGALRHASALQIHVVVQVVGGGGLGLVVLLV